ncbi:hypothetical protein VS868_11930 [Salinimicrobium sp. 3283s]|uniref:hypothetical protein n=1 Tax=Salinimicrobium sp. 3283s TaxID=3114359 RepID=UPI0031EF371F
MKEKVTAFLGNLPKSGSEQFNKALELYRKSKNHSASQVRFLNEQGYSKERLEILLYELKKLHSITDLEVAKARNAKKAAFKQAIEPVPTPREELIAEFAKNIVAENLEERSEDELKAIVECFHELFEGEKPEDIDYKVAAAIIKDHFVKNADNQDLKAPVVLVPVNDIDKAPVDPVKETSEATQEASEASNESKAVTLENTNEVPSQKTLESSEATQNTLEATSPVDFGSDEYYQEKKAAAEKEKFLKQDLADFDVEAEKYNAIKSFAAVLSDYINEDPKDQKSETLKAFILDAKKKYLES